jgi:hypothetical protein
VQGWCCKAHDRTLQRGYRDVGYLLAPRLRSFRPDRFGPRTWERRLGRLRKFLLTDDEAAALAWFAETYPQLMALIPVGEQAQFVAGVWDRQR